MSTSLRTMHCSTPGFLVLHCLPELDQTHVHWIDDAIQRSHALSSSLCLALDLSQPQGLFQCVGSFPMCWLFTLGGQSIGASTSASVLPMNIQDWFPLGLTGLIPLLSKGLSRVFSNTTVQKHQFFGAQPLYGSTLTSIHDYWKNHSFDYMDLCQQSDVSAF